MKLKNEGVEIYISGWDWFIHLLNEWDNSVLKHIMSEIIMYDKEQFGKNPLQGSQMPMNERTKKLTISELKKLGKNNLEQLVKRFNELDLEDMIDQKLKLVEEKQLIADQKQCDDFKCISIINFEKEEGIKKIFRWLNSISHHSLIKAWIDIIKEAKRNISNRLESSSQGSYDAKMVRNE